MADYQKYINALRKCAKEHEKDRTFTGHIIVSDLCRDTANLLESLEQEPVLDKIRAEIDIARFIDKDTKLCKNANASGLEVAMQIIDKYRAEGSEE